MQSDDTVRDAQDSGALVRVLDLFSALTIVAIVAITVIDVFGRYVLNRPLPGGFEITELLLAFTIFAGLPIVTKQESHICVDILIARFPPDAKRIQASVTNVLLAVVLAFLAVTMWSKAGDVARLNDVTNNLGIPIAPLAYFISASCGVSAVASLWNVWRHVSRSRQPVSEGPSL